MYMYSYILYMYLQYTTCVLTQVGLSKALCIVEEIVNFVGNTWQDFFDGSNGDVETINEVHQLIG